MSVLVILPGLDGSPQLQGALPQALQKLPGIAGLQHQTLLYPPEQKLDYLALARWVQPQLPPDQPCFLRGESFGGPLALLLAGCGQGDARLPPPKHLRGVILAASFATCAVPWAAPFRPAIAAWPAQALYAVPRKVWSWWLLGRWATPALLNALQQALRHSDPAVLQNRAVQALQPPALDLAALSVPLLALRGAQDRLIPAHCAQALLQAPQHELHTIDGPHMLLQTQAEVCAPLVADFLLRHAGDWHPQQQVGFATALAPHGNP